MAQIGGRSLMVGALLLLASGCATAGDGAGDGGRPASSSPAGPTSTVLAGAPIPWEQVVAATEARTGRLRKTAGTMEDDRSEGARIESIEEVTEFDRDRLLAERTITVDSGAAPGADELGMFYAEDATYLSAAWVPERCGAEWVSMDAAMAEVGLAGAVAASELFPLDPLGPLAALKPGAPSEVTSRTTTYEVELPALLGFSPSLLAEYPEIVDELDGKVRPAAVTIDQDGDLEVELRVPVSELQGFDVPAFDAIPDEYAEASVWTRWAFDRLDAPIDLEVPTDVAEDPTCAG